MRLCYFLFSRKNWGWAILTCLPLCLPGQIMDNFSDGDLTANPAWQGDTANFRVTPAAELQLDAPDAGASALYLPIYHTGEATWELFTRLEFDPSNANRLRFYLQSDNENLTQGNGYFLAIGKDGSADAIEFFKQTNGTPAFLTAATLAGVAIAPTLRLKMTRDAAGWWTLFADYAGSVNFNQEFQFQDDEFGKGAWFSGFQCAYTATRKDKFFFDDVTLPLMPDTEAPQLISTSLLSDTEIDLLFDEPLDAASASDVSNYLLDNSIGMPAEALPDVANPRLVHLVLTTPLTSMATYTLTINGLSDLSGNLVSNQTAVFTYTKIEAAAAYDLLINEIMADPTPSHGLPDAEYIELYNRSDKVIDLEGFRLSNGSAPQTFPQKLLFPDAYLIVCDNGDLDSMSVFGETLALPSFPALVNSGGTLSLTDPAGNLIHYVAYSLETYKDPFKQSGGYSLELVNPLAPCLGEENWRASANLTGGSPGMENSIFAPSPDTMGPDLQRVFASATSPEAVLLFFSKSLEKASAENPAHYSISNGVQVSSATLFPPESKVVRLQLASSLQPSVLYEVSVAHNVTDCIGNPVGSMDKATLALPDVVENQDIVINEILFNPRFGGFDFVEIYNRSGKIFNLGDLYLGNLRPGIDTVTAAVENNRLLFPGEYAVLGENVADLQNRYAVNNPNFLIVNDLPAFNDDMGNVTLYRAQGAEVVVIDAFDYDENFHNPLLDDPSGVSLERINPDRPTQDPANWHSAASTAGFATPTYRNSQFFAGEPAAVDFFDLPDPVFSPDGDGFKDVLRIHYMTDQPGFVAQIRFFDSEGRLIKSLNDSELLGNEGFFTWDGDTDDGQKASIGIYVIWIQLFHPDGEVREFKKTCVVGGRI